VPAGGGVEVGAEVVADLLPGRAEPGAVLLLAQPVLEPREEEWQALPQVAEDDLNTWVPVEQARQHEAHRVRCRLVPRTAP
jgi:hypothetical protein